LPVTPSKATEIFADDREMTKTKCFMMKNIIFILLLSCAVSAQAAVNCMPLEKKIEEKKWLIELHERDLVKKPIHEGEQSGVNNDGVYQGRYQGVDVVVKKMIAGVPIELQVIYNQLKFSTYISAMGFGPRFFGVMRFADGGFGIVSERIAPSWIAREINAHTDRNGLPEAVASVSMEVRQKWYRGMETIVMKLTQEKIHMFDMQWLLTPEGRVYLIDYEFYKVVRDKETLFENYTSLRGFRRQILGDRPQ